MSTIKSFAGIEEKILEIDNPAVFSWTEVYNALLKQVGNRHFIKLNLIKTTPSSLYFHLIALDGFNSFIDDPFSPSEIDLPESKEKNLVSLIIPTGIGAAFGGYAGDANVIANMFSKDCKYLLTHPNVVNGSVLSDPPQNMIYAEGFSLDQFLLGRINFIYPSRNKIGVVFDRGITDERLEYEINVLNAAKVFYGCEIIGYSITEKPLIIEPTINELGFSTGVVQNLDYLIEKALKLKELGATAIAICCLIPDLELNKNYTFGHGIDPIGGVESIISRAVSSCTGLVSAHAPVLVTDEKIDYKSINPVSAAEYIAKTFLPSVISGLRCAPQIVGAGLPNKTKSFKDISDLVVPYNAFGSAGVFFQNECFQNVILVKENKTCLDVDPYHLNISFNVVETYSEIFDNEKMAKSGIDPDVLKRPIKGVKQV